jgi:hypothetical protein
MNQYITIWQIQLLINWEQWIKWMQWKKINTCRIHHITVCTTVSKLPSDVPLIYREKDESEINKFNSCYEQQYFSTSQRTTQPAQQRSRARLRGRSADVWFWLLISIQCRTADMSSCTLPHSYSLWCSAELRTRQLFFHWTEKIWR